MTGPGGDRKPPELVKLGVRSRVIPGLTAPGESVSTPAGESTVLLVAVAAVVVGAAVAEEGVGVVTGAGVLLKEMPEEKSGGLGADAESAVWPGVEDEVVDVADWGFVVAETAAKERALGGGYVL